MGKDTLELFVRCAAGFEDVLADELRTLRLGRVRPQVGGVSATGRLVDAYRACLWSRVATRVQFVVGRVSATGAEELYQGVYALAWEDQVRQGSTIAVDAHGTNDQLKNTAFTALKVKDAVCDRLREARGTRPDVNAKDPDLSINVAIHPKKATIYINLSGASLHRRGYRQDGVQSAAPLKETLAAGMVLAAGWRDMAHAGAVFVDPMCGSGTLAIEAAMIAADVAPGLLRTRWGFQGWTGHDEDLWQQVLARAYERMSEARPTVEILAGDIDETALAIAKQNAQRAGVADMIRFQRADAAQLERRLRGVRRKGGSVGLLAMNPPYDQRLKTEGGLPQVRAAISAATDAVPSGWKVALISPDAGIDTCLGRIPLQVIDCYNGPIEVSIRIFEIDEKSQSSIEVVSLVGKQHTVRVAEKGSDQFAARLRKASKERLRWAKRESITCVRLYDADLPDFALSVDLFEGRSGAGEVRLVLVEEYPRPASVDGARAERRLADACAIASAVLEIEPTDVLVHRWTKGAKRPGKSGTDKRIIKVKESGLTYSIDIEARPDTGLPLAQRGLRAYVREHARGKRVLVLGGLGSACALAAIRGGARSVDCVEPFKDRIEFIKASLKANGLTTKGVRLIEKDLLSWLDEANHNSYDLVVLVPPSWIGAKSQNAESFELARDAREVIERSLRMVSAGKELVFFCRERGVKIDPKSLTNLAREVNDISAQVTDRDFERSRITNIVLSLKP